MKYALGELVSMPFGGAWQVLIDETAYLVGNVQDIPDELQCDQQTLIFKYLPDDQFATYVPIEKVEKVMGMHEELVNAVELLLSHHERLMPWESDSERLADELGRKAVEKARTA